MPTPIKQNGLLKPYNIVLDDGNNSATINLYGEVVQARPVDWWTGEPVPGNFIAVDEFLKDVEELAEKDSITVHINSVGGDFYAGLAIYNRLRALKAHVTTINDGLAASAGSIIFMAGDTRKVNAGSNLMIHGVLSFFYGYYNAVELQTAIKTLESHNKAAVAAYVEATGLDKSVVEAAMSEDTYMTGQEAVDAGWADEVITNEDEQPVAMKLSPDKSRLYVGNMAVAACLFGKLPDTIPQMSAEEWAEVSATTPGGTEPHETHMQSAPQIDIEKNQTGGINMEIKNMEDLRTAAPDLLAQAEADARAEGVRAERERLQGIEAIQAVIGDKALVEQAKYGEKPMNAQELAFEAMKASAAQGASVLAGMEADTTNSGAANVTAAPAPAVEPTKNEDEEAEALLIGNIPANLKKEDK